MKNILIGLANTIHLKVFGHEMGQDMKGFLGNLSWSFMMGIIVMPLLMIITTLAGRFMGPSEFGKYSLLLVINQFLVVFIFFGLDTAAIKHLAKAKDFKDKRTIISSVSSFIFLALLALTGLTIAAYPLLARYLPDYSLFAILTVYYTIIVAIKAMFDVIVRGMQDFKTQAFARIFEIGVVILAFSLIFLLQRKTSYSWFIAVITIGAIFISAYYFLRLSKYFGRGDKSTLLQLLVEGKLFFVSALLGTIFLSTDRLVVAHYLDIRSLGIYSAYYLSSFGLITQAIQLFTNVFFPASARVEDKSFARKIDRLFVIGFIPLAIAIGLMMLIMLSIFGRAYPVNYLYVIEFTVFSCLYFFLALYNTVILDATHGIYKKYLILANAVSVATIIFYGLAVAFHFISIAVIVAALAANSLITIVIQRYFISRMQQPRLP